MEFLCLYSRPANPKRPLQFVPPVWVVEWEGIIQEFPGRLGGLMARQLFNKIRNLECREAIDH